MASLIFLGIALWISLFSPALSLTCGSQKLKTADKKPYDRCLDLPVLESYLHYTYDAANSSLSVAFVAAPAKSDGWIAWAINPTGEGMVGAQSLIAFSSNGSLVVKPYNISSYSDIKEGNLSFDVWNLRAETVSGGKLAILASVKVPEKADSVNHVWQVGERVTDGQPEKHNFASDNLNSKGKLKLAPATATATAEPSPVLGSGGDTKSSGDTASKNGGVLGNNLNVGAYLGFLVFLGALFVF